MTEQPQDHVYERTVYEARMDVMYNTVLWGLHRRFYERSSSVLSIIQLVLASSAVATAIKSDPMATSILGVFIAALSVFNHVWSPKVRAMEVDLARKRWLELAAKTADMTVADIDRRIDETEMQDPSPIEALRKVAYNMNVETNGRNTWVKKLGLVESIAKGFA